jgi:hypothetical protein
MENIFIAALADWDSVVGIVMAMDWMAKGSES